MPLTPPSVLGPFYPVARRGHGDDLIALGRTPLGQLLHLSGTVRNMKGQPLAGVTVEVWQANGAGRYHHPSDASNAPIDPGFVGSGLTLTDLDGQYRFRTIVPGPYCVGPDRMRAPHIHFQLTGRCDRHVTQMWFAGHVLNDQDWLWTRMSPEERRQVTATWTGTCDDDSQALAARFDIVLASG